MLYILLVVFLVLALAGGPYTGWHTYGWYPSGGLGLVVLIIVILLLMGRI